MAPRPSKMPVILITAMITTVIISALWLLGIVGVTRYLTGNSPSFAVKITAPPQAEVGETIFIEMEVSNPTDQSLTLSTIDLTDTLLDGFKVNRVLPAESSSYGGFGSTTYEFSKTIASGGSLNVKFSLEATKAGVWTGDVDFTNPSLSFVTSSTTIRVNEAGPPPVVAATGNPEPPFVLGIDTPHLVTRGQDFTLRVNVTNPTDSPMFLDFIDFGGTLPEGFDLQSISPSPEHDESDQEIWSLNYSKSLLPGETLAAEFVVKAVKEGIWTGALDFWDGRSESPVSSSVTIRVNPPATETETPD